MKLTVFYLHWNKEELDDRIDPLVRAGFDVSGHWKAETGTKIAEPYPAAFIISLDRLPSHGKAVAEWIWEAKKRQGIPIVFEGGQADKVDAIRQKFPRAIFCQTGEVVEALDQAGIRQEEF